MPATEMLGQKRQVALAPEAVRAVENFLLGQRSRAEDFVDLFTRSKLARLPEVGKITSFSPDSAKNARGAVRPATSYISAQFRIPGT